MDSEDKNLKSDLKNKVVNNSKDKEFKIAQTLDENELNNLSNSPNLEALAPEENIEESPGLPQESLLVNDDQTSNAIDVEDEINTDQSESSKEESEDSEESDKKNNDQSESSIIEIDKSGSSLFKIDIDNEFNNMKRLKFIIGSLKV